MRYNRHTTMHAIQEARADSPPDRLCWPRHALALVAAIAVVRVVILLLGANRYGYFGDELYFLAASRHMALGFVDFPPLIAALAWILRHTTGDSLIALHAAGAMVGAATVYVTAMIARELGGGRFGIALACVGFMSAPVYWVLNHLFTMNMFESLLWMALAYVVIRIINTGNQRLWVWFGIFAGIGMWNKYSIAIFGFSIVAGLVLTEHRRALVKPWIWIGGAVALLIWLPNAIWQTQHGWPFLQFIHNVHASNRDVAHTPFTYFVSQIMMLLPTTFPLWFGGLCWLLWTRKYRLLGIAYVVALAVMIVDKGKDYYLSPIYPLLFAAGAVALEQWVSRRKTNLARRAAQAVAVLVLAIPMALLLPMFVPLLPVNSYLAYQAKVPFKMQATERAHALAKLPHYYAWDFGWNAMVDTVAKAWDSLPTDERSHAIIFAENFGEAGAIDMFGPKYGLPRSYSGHQNNWYWGPPPFAPQTYIIVGSDTNGERRHFGDVQVFAELNNPLGAVWENGPVLICRQPKFNLHEIWPQLKVWQ